MKIPETWQHWSDWAFPVVFYVVFTFLCGSFPWNAWANDGFYVMVGVGDSSSDIELFDDDDCHFGAGFAIDHGQVTWDIAYRNRFDCDADVDDDDADVETIGVDLRWYPFQ